MALLYAEETVKSLDHEFATTEIYEGDLVTREIGGGCHPTDAANDSSVDAIVPHLRNADNIAEHEYDYQPFGEFTFNGDGTVTNSDLVPTQPRENTAVWQPLTVGDDTMTPPSIERNAVVGVPEGTPGRVVEEGYTHDGVEYSDAGTGGFIPLGTADIQEGSVVDEFGVQVRVRLDL